jgi:hypothetical protein
VRRSRTGATRTRALQIPVGRSVLTRYLLGLAVVVAMLLGGGAVGCAALAVALAYDGVLDAVVEGVLVFAGFTFLYDRYDANDDEQWSSTTSGSSPVASASKIL